MSDCIFCKIIKGEIPSAKVLENEKLVVFKDINPVAPVHLLIVPKEHIEDINGLHDGNAAIAADCMLAAREAAVLSGIADSGYRVISNCGKDSGQLVNHLHFHLIGGRDMGSRII